MRLAWSSQELKLIDQMADGVGAARQRAENYNSTARAIQIIFQVPVRIFRTILSLQIWDGGESLSYIGKLVTWNIETLRSKQNMLMAINAIVPSIVF